MSPRERASSVFLSAERLGSWNCFFGGAVSLLVLLPNLWAVVTNSEEWPFTSAPMFSHYISESTPRYAFDWQGVYEDGHEERLSYFSAGADWALFRLFFKYYYGSADPSSVFARFPEDNPEQFSERLGRFFRIYAGRVSERQHRVLISIRVFIRKLNSESEPSRLVGVFKVTDGEFVREDKSRLDAR